MRVSLCYLKMSLPISCIWLIRCYSPLILNLHIYEFNIINTGENDEFCYFKISFFTKFLYPLNKHWKRTLLFQKIKNKFTYLTYYLLNPRIMCCLNLTMSWLRNSSTFECQTSFVINLENKLKNITIHSIR